MKKILLTLAKWFHVDLTEIKYVEVEKIVEVPKERLVALDGLVNGDLTVKGDLVVDGALVVFGGCSCLASEPQPRKRNAKGQFIKED